MENKMPKLHKGQPEAGTRPWFTVKAKIGNAAEVFIYDEIGIGWYGGGVDALELLKEIDALGLKVGDELTVRINSPGGNFIDGNAIYNNLRSLKAKVITRVDGVAASAASIIAMAGDRIEMPANAMLFIHNPWTIVGGDANTMRKAADDLDQMKSNALGTYMRKAGDKIGRSELAVMLDAETWLSAEESVKYGLADVVDEPVRASALAKFDFAALGIPVPAALAKAKESIASDMARRREQLKALHI
ncbi:MAG: Clp protease ClpP [Sideroxyarcus sp.]|nr:Clp protease ClpP [Sideroxyarcus sp.]